ncbi:MAG: segregation/condensation protein A [Firmicutes bacterium]|nr:segregation/condensation protein A [Bacillota bacterium]
MEQQNETAQQKHHIHITDFDGPLDLLLHLIREKKLDIKTVQLSLVTEQYLEFLSQLDQLNLDDAVEFIDIGATLVEIKSRGILPKEKIEEDPEDIEAKLLRQLEEYKLLKEASEKLKETENVDRFYKAPVEFKPEYKYVLDNLSIDMLTSAFQKVMHRLQFNAPQIVTKQIRMDRFTVGDKMADIRTRITSGKRVMFFDLFEADFTKSEVINTFLALLELLKTGEIGVVQDNQFADIKIEAKK